MGRRGELIRDSLDSLAERVDAPELASRMREVGAGRGDLFELVEDPAFQSVVESDVEAILNRPGDDGETGTAAAPEPHPGDGYPGRSALAALPARPTGSVSSGADCRPTPAERRD